MVDEKKEGEALEPGGEAISGKRNHHLSQFKQKGNRAKKIGKGRENLKRAQDKYGKGPGPVGRFNETLQHPEKEARSLRGKKHKKEKGGIPEGGTAAKMEKNLRKKRTIQFPVHISHIVHRLKKKLVR